MKDERGVTMIELLVTVTMSLVVFGLVGTSLVAYQKDSLRTTRQNDGQDTARTAVDRIVRELRNAASARTAPTLIESAGPYDLVFQTITPTAPAGATSNPTSLSRVRYCLPPDPSGSAANAVLIQQIQRWTTAAAPVNPWPVTGGSSTACPSTPATGTTVTTRLSEDVMNRYAGADRSAFTYDSSTLSQITTVSVDLFVDASPTQSPGETELKSAAFLRNQNQAPVVSFTDTPTGGGHILLNGGGSSDPDGQQLTFKWFRVVGTTATPIGSTGLLDWAPGAGSYTVRLQVTDPGGLVSTEDRNVVIT